MAIDLFFKILELLSGQQMIQDKLQRNELVIRILKQVGLDPEHPPADFEGVYNYALVEYGVGKPQVCLEIFRAREVRSALRQAFDQNSGQAWLEAGERFLEGSEIGDRVRAIAVDPKRELTAFAACFLAVARRSRMPKEVLLAQQVGSVQQQMAQMMERLERLPTLEGMRSELARLGSEAVGLLGGSGQDGSEQACRAFGLAQQMRGWFETLGYRFESHAVWDADFFEWVINIPVRRGRYDRILVRGIDGEVGIRDVRALAESVATLKTDEGWIVTMRRISQAARAELEGSEGLAAFTFDELLDQDADFSSYLDWLEGEIAQRGIEARYVPLACTKEEVDPVTHQRLGMSRYGAADGWTEGYIDRWLDDPAKEHLSILGEFGTGKTWLTLHYAARALQAYREAQGKGMLRPRLPIVIPLRDYAKAVSVESLFSEFFFRKHEIPIPGYSAFEQLNRMGKLLLIFDGFDEMAARVDKQQMINNFWELAKVVVPGSKVVLTCRTEHFPEAREGRALLNAELQASTKDLTGETPQFEVLELEKFEDEQIRQVLLLSSSEGTVVQVMGNPQLLDLARRPVMTELILEALPEIEAGKPVDMSRVYLYAVKRKMERDIKAERTFTSMADKLYFLCELSWEMLSNDRMSINYREFPDRIRKLFGAAVQEEKDLDHWHYDMMGQTMLIRNADGDYSPAHRSLLEFFVAFKFAAELGALAPDFLELAQMKSGIDSSLEPQDYTWSEYFGGVAVAPLKGFVTESLEKLRSGFGKETLSKAVRDLIFPLIVPIHKELYSILKQIQFINRDSISTTDCISGNILNLSISLNKSSLENLDLSSLNIRGGDFSLANLRKSNFSFCEFEASQFTSRVEQIFSLAFSSGGEFLAGAGGGLNSGQITIWDIKNNEQIISWVGHKGTVRSVVFFDNDNQVITGSEDHCIRFWDRHTGKLLKSLLGGHNSPVRSIVVHPSNLHLFTCGEDGNVFSWNILDNEKTQLIQLESQIRSLCISPDGNYLAIPAEKFEIKIFSVSENSFCMSLNGHKNHVKEMAYSPDGLLLASASKDYSVIIWNMQSGLPVKTLHGHSAELHSLSFDKSGKLLVTSDSSGLVKVWSLKTYECIFSELAHNNGVQSIRFSPTSNLIASGSQDCSIKIWNLESHNIHDLTQGYSSWVKTISLSSNGRYIASGGQDSVVRIWNSKTGECCASLTDHQGWIQSLDFDKNSNLIVSGGSDRKVRVWNTENKHLIHCLEGHNDTIWTVSFNPSGTMIASAGGSQDRSIRVWDVKTGKCLNLLQGHLDRINSLSFYSESKLISCGADRAVKFWDLETGEEIKSLKKETNWAVKVAFSKDNFLMASADEMHGIYIWDLETGHYLAHLKGHCGQVKSLCFNQNSDLLASASDDLTIRIWNWEKEEYIESTQEHTRTIFDIKFSPNEDYLVSCSEDGTIKVWKSNLSECIRSLEVSLPYEGMNITGVKGLPPATIASLKALGAIDDANTGDPP